jgi:asparagine N-glycosylation enzyme membrane subunit Stt3
MNGLSAAYYLYMGQWKDYVFLFGVVELLLFFAAMGVFAANIVKKPRSFSKSSLVLSSVLCVMQLFPIIGAFFIYTSYAFNGLYHAIVFMIGIPNLKQLLVPQIKFREH